MLNIRQFLKNNEKDIVLAVGVILVSLISFGAGRLSAPGISKTPIIFEKIPNEAFMVSGVEATISNIPKGGEVSQESQKVKKSESQCLLVASKNSNKYHYPWCIGAKNISEQNKICFKSKEEAESRGYAPAGNCPDL